MRRPPSTRLDERLRNAKPSRKFLEEQAARYAKHCEACRDRARLKAGAGRRRNRELAAALKAHGLSIVDNPRLVYLDCNGKLHPEEETSAEELIRRWKKEHEKK
jgi:non-ribosomal peptide synthetase component E (peptide arylation enzyme)